MHSRSIKVDSMLAEALKFTHDDLSANRDGYMTKEQRKRLRLIGLSQYLPSAVGSIVFGAAFILCLLLLLARLRDNTLLILSAFFGFGSLWLAGYAYVQRRKFKADLEKGDVVEAAGQINLNIFGLSNRVSFSIGIEKQRFRVTRQILLVFKNGEPYRIYYTPNTKTLLSAEQIPQGKPG